MEVRYSPDINNYKTLSTDQLRSAFLVDNLFQPGRIVLLYSDIDRAIVGSAVPLKNGLKLESSKKEMAAEYFTERRELGVVNIGDEGTIKADGEEYRLQHKDVLYIGRGVKDVNFFSTDERSPAKYYIVSYPAHHSFPVALKKFSEAEPSNLGSMKDANKRTINKFIHGGGIQSSQLVLGITELEEGSVWNTMPVHTHQRRSEIYMYFNLDEQSVVFHMMGQPDETRHIVVRNGQAVISPSWSIHSGAATKNYSFIWAMGGENQAFDDMDAVLMKDLK